MHVRGRVEHVQRYIDRPTEAHAVLHVENLDHHAEITLKAGRFLLRGHRRSRQDMYASIDAAADKIERQLKKHKEKLHDHKTNGHAEFEAGRGPPRRPRHPRPPGPAEPPGRQEHQFQAKPMSVDEAILQLELLDAEFFVFQNAEDRAINVVYRRDDGNFGLIEASRAETTPDPGPRRAAARGPGASRRSAPLALPSCRWRCHLCKRPRSAMKIVEFLRPDAVIANLAGPTGQAVLAELCRPLAAAHRLEPQRLLETLLDREKLGSTGIGDGVAIPHGKVARPARAGGELRPGARRASTSGPSTGSRPTSSSRCSRPRTRAGAHLKALARISRIFKNPAFRDAILKAGDAAEIYRLIEAEDAKY